MSSTKGRPPEQRADEPGALVVADTSENTDHGAAVRAVFDDVEESPEIAAQREAMKQLAGVYLRGEIPGRAPDLRMAAALYAKAGAAADHLSVTDMMAEDLGRNFTAAEVARHYVAAGPDGLARLEGLITTYMQLAETEATAYESLIDFLGAVGDSARLVEVGDKLVELGGPEVGNRPWMYAVQAYKRAKANDKLAALGDEALRRKNNSYLAFRAYREVSGPLPESSGTLLAALAEWALTQTLPDPETAIEALKLAGAHDKLIECGDRLAQMRMLNPSFALRAYISAGALDKVVAYGRELLATEFGESGNTHTQQKTIEALDNAAKMALGHAESAGSGD